MFQKNNLQRQLRDVEHELAQKREELLILQKKHGSSHTEIVQLKMDIDHHQEKIDKVRKVLLSWSRGVGRSARMGGARRIMQGSAITPNMGPPGSFQFFNKRLA